MIITLDVVVEAPATLASTLATTVAVAGLAPSDVAIVRVGTANGWPVVHVHGTPRALLAFVRVYDDDVHITFDDLATYVVRDVRDDA